MTLTTVGLVPCEMNGVHAAPARLALLPSAAQLTGTILIATLHVLVGAIHAALLMALETAVILFGFVAIGYAVRGIMLGTAEMQSKLSN